MNKSIALLLVSFIGMNGASAQEAKKIEAKKIASCSQVTGFNESESFSLVQNDQKVQLKYAINRDTLATSVHVDIAADLVCDKEGSDNMTCFSEKSGFQVYIVKHEDKARLAIAVISEEAKKVIADAKLQLVEDPEVGLSVARSYDSKDDKRGSCTIE